MNWQGWHFLPETRRLRYGSHQVVKPDAWINVEGELRMCEWGLHASKRPIDALTYAPGPIVCRVELRGDLQHEDDKSVGRERRVVWMAGATETLRDFARRCALDVAHLWDAPEVVLQYLETGDESIRAAARDAARAAARDAAGDAARAAAGAAAWAAGGAAARDAAWAAAREKQNRHLAQMLGRLKP